MESTIITITEATLTLLRPGKLSVSELSGNFGLAIDSAPSLLQLQAESGITPGMLDEHYAPRKPLYLLPVSFEDPRASELLSQFPEYASPTAAFLALSGLPINFTRDPKQIRILSAEKSLAVI